MAIVDSNGDGSVYVKSSGGQIKIGAGGADQVSVGPGGSSFAGGVTVSGDLNASAGGMVKTYEFFSYRTLQGATPVMSSSQFTVSGTAAAGNGLTFYFTKQPLRGSGSILGVTLYSEDGTIKSGSLTGSVFVNGTLATTLILSTGSIGSVTLSKDAVTFNGSSLMTVQLTASAGYLTDVALSCSWGALVEVEF